MHMQPLTASHRTRCTSPTLAAAVAPGCMLALPLLHRCTCRLAAAAQTKCMHVPGTAAPILPPRTFRFKVLSSSCPQGVQKKQQFVLGSRLVSTSSTRPPPHTPNKQAEGVSWSPSSQRAEQACSGLEGAMCPPCICLRNPTCTHLYRLYSAALYANVVQQQVAGWLAGTPLVLHCTPHPRQATLPANHGQAAPIPSQQRPWTGNPFTVKL